MSAELDDVYGEPPRRARATLDLDQRLADVPRREPLLLDARTPVLEAIEAMNERHVGYALVLRDGALAGIFTERDVLTKVAAADDLDPATAPVSRVMTPDPDTLPASASVAFALHRMSVEGYRHIPLVDDDGQPAGVVAVRDIVTWMVEHLPPEHVQNLPPEPTFPTSVDGG